MFSPNIYAEEARTSLAYGDEISTDDLQQIQQFLTALSVLPELTEYTSAVSSAEEEARIALEANTDQTSAHESANVEAWRQRNA